MATTSGTTTPVSPKTKQGKTSSLAGQILAKAQSSRDIIQEFSPLSKVWSGSWVRNIFASGEAWPFLREKRGHSNIV